MVNCKDKENLTECILRKLIVLVAVLALLIPVLSPEVFAASSVTISTESSVKGGDTFTVAVTFGGGSVGRVDASLSYDTDKLTYISGGRQLREHRLYPAGTGRNGRQRHIQYKIPGSD